MALIAADVRGWRGEDPELLIHALAQLPDECTARIEEEPARTPPLRRLAEAYGIAGRVEFGPTGAEPPDLAIERARSVNGASSALRVVAPGGRVAEVRTPAELIEALDSSAERAPAIVRGSDELLSGIRLVVVTNVPNHYRVPLFNALAVRMEAAGGELSVLFTDGGPRERRPWVRYPEMAFEHAFVPGRSIGGTRGPIGLGAELGRRRPNVVVAPGFAPFIGATVARFARRADVPFGLWSGDTLRQPTARGHLRRVERRWLARRASFGLAYGSLAGEYMRTLSPSLPLVIVRNSAPLAERLPRDAEREVVRFLAVGQAIPRKGLDVAVDAFLRLADLPCVLTVVGAGPELSALRARAAGSERVRLLGAVESDRVLECYREADAVVFPSRSDVFGLALVEAMGAGLPTITAAAPGAVPDLAVDGENCVIVPDHDPSSWADAVRRLVEDPGLREALGESGGRSIAARWTLAHSVDAWIAGLRLALKSA